MNAPTRKALDIAVELGHVRRVERDGLTLYNYTDKCTFERAWDETTLQARGLIYAGEQLVARPFPKFFNTGEPDCPPLPFARGHEVLPKIDGSLGIWFHHDDQWRCATRGSLANPFIDYAMQYAHYFDGIVPDWTVLTEIVMPSHLDGLRRACVHKPGLYLLGIKHRETGREPAYLSLRDGLQWPGFWVEPVHIPYEDLCKQAECLEGAEGWVLRFHDERTTRAKVKTAWYVKLAKIINGVTQPKIADLMAEDPSGAWMAAFPEELLPEVQGIMAIINERLGERERHIAEVASHFPLLNRKEYALAVQRSTLDPLHKPIAFLLYDRNFPKADNILLRKDPWIRGETA
jgi:RNA ligase